MADKRISQLIERTDIANNDVLPIVASGATTTNKVTISTIQDWMQDNLDVGVTSVGLSVPSAFSVSGSPVTTSGNITISGAGTTAQYIRGDGSLADFPSSIGGGGASVSYYLNGSVSQGTIGGVAYRELSKSPILGAGTDFTINADGYIASFITDAGDPSLLEIPGGNWNFETYFQASSGGGTPTFYVELYKVSSGGTATLIATSSGSPELIAFGTNTTPYFSSLAVPTTTLALTDRLAIRYYVAHSGRTITLHTENNTLCQIITTFTTGLTALNGLTAQVQNFATGTSGTDFNISSASTTHTFNLPDASASNRGAVTTGTQTFAGYKIFNGTIGANVDIQLATQGTALNTFIKNINATGQTSIGSNGFGFNNANNIYFSGSSKGGGIIAFNNTGNQTYTLQNASGTLAFTSDLNSYLPLTGGTLTGTLGGTAATFSGTITAQSSAGSGLRMYGSSGTNQWDIYLNSTNLRISDNTGTGNIVFDRPLNGTSASFSGDLTASSNAFFGTFNGNDKYHFEPFTNAAGGANNAYFVSGKTDNNERSGFVFQARNSNGEEYNAVIVEGHNSTSTTTPFSIASTGAATFSSSVTATQGIFKSTSGNQLRIAYDDSYYWNVQRVAADGRLSFSDSVNGEKLVLTTAGNVGIGTASPVSKLSVDGDIKLQSSTATAKSILFSSPASNWGPQDSSIKFTPADGTNAATSLSFNLWDGLTNTIERMRITSAGNVGIGTASPNRLTEIVGSNGATLGVSTSSSGSSILYGRLAMYSTAASNSYIDYGGEIRSYSGAGIDYSDLRFYTAGGSASGERMRITSGGFVLVNRTTTLNNGWLEVNGDGSRSGVACNQVSTASSAQIYFSNPNGIVGSIFSSGSATSYNTSSDYRLKENIKPVENALSILNQLKPCSFYFIADADEEVMGFIAHEVQEVIPQAVTGEKDGFRIEEIEVSPAQLDEEGNVITEAVVEEKEIPVYQGIDHSKLVPLLVAAIQELKAEIDSLKTK